MSCSIPNGSSFPPCHAYSHIPFVLIRNNTQTAGFVRLVEWTTIFPLSPGRVNISLIEQKKKKKKNNKQRTEGGIKKQTITRRPTHIRPHTHTHTHIYIFTHMNVHYRATLLPSLPLSFIHNKLHHKENMKH